jgi:hypothetical protein
VAGCRRFSTCACSGHTNGGNALRTHNAILWWQVAEAEVPGGIKHQMRSPEVLKEFCRRTRAALREPKPQINEDQRACIERLEREISNLADAIAGGALRASPILAARLTITCCHPAPEEAWVLA